MSSAITALWCWYHGGPFRGYQSQRQGPTVQGTLTAALREAGVDRGPVAAGRTDLGVHARMQVLSLHAAGVPALTLPPSLGVALTRQAAQKFNAQWSAVGKEYRYRLQLVDDAVWAPCSWRVDVDPRRVEQVLQHALGTHDFWAFHEKASPRRPRTLSSAVMVERPGGGVDLRLVGDGFGRYQVRYLVGGAVGVARGELREADYLAGIQRAVELKGIKAPAQGLILWEVRYPSALDPFSAEERAASAGVPREPPFL